jgi:hypothetical protein
MEFLLGSKDWARVRLSPDGQRLLGSWREGLTERSVFHGRELPAVAWNRGAAPECIWDSDLARRATVVRDRAGAVVVVSDLAGETRYGPFEDVPLKSICFSTSPTRLLFVFTRQGRSWVWIEGEEFGPYAAVERVRWYGSTPTFVAQSGSERHLWIGGKPLGPFAALWFVEIAADGVCGLSYEEAGAHFILHQERRYGPFAKRPGFALGPGGRLAIEHAHDDEVAVELADGREVGRFTRVRSLDNCFSPDGSRLAFAYDHGDFAGFYLDGERREKLGYTDGPWWSPDGRHVAWGADVTGGLLVIDAVDEALPARIDWESAGSFRFAPNGDFCFTLAVDGRQLLRIGQQEFGPFSLEDSARQDEKVVFSADGAHFAFRYEDGETFVRHDARVLGPYDNQSSYTLSPEGTLYLATLDTASQVASLLTFPARAGGE